MGRIPIFYDEGRGTIYPKSRGFRAPTRARSSTTAHMAGLARMEPPGESRMARTVRVSLMIFLLKYYGKRL